MKKCLVCSQELHYIFMAKNRVWHKAGFGSHDTACIPCLAKRLGRELTPNDFYKKPSCNIPIFMHGVQGFLDYWDKLWADHLARKDKFWLERMRSADQRPFNH